MPHLGLGVIAAMLGRAGHTVTVFDELMIGKSLDLFAVIEAEKPEVIGVTLYSAIARENEHLLQRIVEATHGRTPIIVGGPHATLFAEEIQAALPVSYICQGEAEHVVLDLFAGAQVQPKAVIVSGQPADMRQAATPDFTRFLLHRERLTRYPLQTSRGCPFRCSFCDVRKLTGTQRWRARPLEACIEEIRSAARLFPRMESILMVDDCPTANLPRLKQFLEMLIRENLAATLEVSNVRADHVDEELCALLRKANCRFLTIGVEHADPEMFKSIDKGETLEDVERAAAIIRRSGIPLGLCFVIGLPGDTYEKHRRSVAFARKHRPHVIYWNALLPYPGTRVREYFEKHGKLLPIQTNSFNDLNFRPVPPAAEEPCFPRELRMKAQFEAIVETSMYVIRSPAQLAELFALGRQYGVSRGRLLRSLWGVYTRTLPWLASRRVKSWFRWGRRAKAAC